MTHYFRTSSEEIAAEIQKKVRAAFDAPEGERGFPAVFNLIAQILADQEVKIRALEQRHLGQ